MAVWILLLLTVGCGYITFDAFRWSGSVKDAPFGAIARMWKGGLSHLSVQEQDQLKNRYASRLLGAGQLAWVFLAVTVVLAMFTIRAFFQ